MASHSETEVLIIGAGPTGLAAALFLQERGVAARLIDQAEAPSETSKAQVVNPRALDLLEPSGVAARIVAEGRPIRGVRFAENWAPLAAIELHDLPSPHRMTVLPQARTEALLAEALALRGIRPERGLVFQLLDQTEEGVTGHLVDRDGAGQSIFARFLLAADGAHSAVRESLGIAFEGHAFPESWPLYDLELDDPLDLDHAHVNFVDDGLLFLLAIRPGLWRVFGNMPDPLALLPAGAKPGAIHWQSAFHIADRCAADLIDGRVALAGDAAHVHSPIGARGMNLGIEDAFVFAACAANALKGDTYRLADYHRLRHPIHETVVSRMDRLTALARGKPGWLGAARHYLVPGAAGFGPIARAMAHFVTGLDHDVQVR